MTIHRQDPRRRLDALLPRALDRLEALLEPRDSCEACGRSDDDRQLAPLINSIRSLTEAVETASREAPAADAITEVRRVIVRPADWQHDAPRVDPDGDCTPAPETRSLPSDSQQAGAPPVGGSSAPEPALCPYCHQRPERCAEIKATRPEDFEVLHYHDPEIVQRREELATAEMLESMRRSARGC